MSRNQPPARGIEHVGITVPDIDAATAYFRAVFGAEVLHETWLRSRAPAKGEKVETSLGLLPGTELKAVRLLRLGNGPAIELFEYGAEAQRPPARPSDFGLQHIAIYVDDLEAACGRIERHGGELLAGPNRMPGPESGEGNRYRYTRTPWGSTVELVCYPSAQRYEGDTALRRWRP